MNFNNHTTTLQINAFDWQLYFYLAVVILFIANCTKSYELEIKQQFQRALLMRKTLLKHRWHQPRSMEYTITEEKGKVSVVLASFSVLSLVLRQEEWVPPSAPSAHAHETHPMEQSLWMVNSSNSFLFHIRYLWH